jgi:prepilin-type N-terminal cleavage/methylation domain-containing protein
MKKGFTLVEIIISMMIFSIVAVVALAALIKIIDANKKAQTTHDAVTNLSFALDSMSREMRSSSSYYCYIQDPSVQSIINLRSTLTQPATNNCWGGFDQTFGAKAIIFAFVTNKVYTTGSLSPCHLVYAYRLRQPVPFTDWVLEKSEQSNCSVTGSVSSRLTTNYTVANAQDTYFPIVATTSVSINKYYLRMFNDPSTNKPFPLFFLELSGNAGLKESSKSYFTVQTASTARIP